MDNLIDPSDLRRDIKRRRKMLSVEKQQQASERVHSHVVRMNCFNISRSVAAYCAGNGELSVDTIIETVLSSGRSCFLPVVTSATEMVFTPHQQESHLVRNRYGLLEPDKPYQAVSATEMDLVLVPLVACDHDGTRLGMGGGYYDRFFAAKLTDRASDPFLLGIAHDFQLLAHIPRQQWDVPLDAIATPGGITYFRKV